MFLMLILSSVKVRRAVKGYYFAGIGPGPVKDPSKAVKLKGERGKSAVV